MSIGPELYCVISRHVIASINIINLIIINNALSWSLWFTIELQMTIRVIHFYVVNFKIDLLPLLRADSESFGK